MVALLTGLSVALVIIVGFALVRANRFRRSVRALRDATPDPGDRRQ